MKTLEGVIGLQTWAELETAKVVFRRRQARLVPERRAFNTRILCNAQLIYPR